MAAREFASKGHDGARVGSIVARSKISKNLVYHYFEISNRYTFSFVLGVDLGIEERVEARLQHISEIVMSYLFNFK